MGWEPPGSLPAQLAVGFGRDPISWQPEVVSLFVLMELILSSSYRSSVVILEP